MIQQLMDAASKYHNAPDHRQIHNCEKKNHLYFFKGDNFVDC